MKYHVWAYFQLYQKSPIKPQLELNTETYEALEGN